MATNAHVVEPLARYFVGLPDAPTVLEGRLLWIDRELDLAVVEVPGLRARPLPLSTAEPRRGTPVYAVGYPESSFRRQLENDRIASTLADGTITSTYATSWFRGMRRLKVIQHNAAIGHGNSGGPLFDDCGRVIGVNTQGPGGDVNGMPLPEQTFIASSISELTLALERSPRRIPFTVSSQTCAQLAAPPPRKADAGAAAKPAPAGNTAAPEGARSGGIDLEAIMAWIRERPSWIWIAAAAAALLGALLVGLGLRRRPAPAAAAFAAPVSEPPPAASPAAASWPALIGENGAGSIPLDPELLDRPPGFVIGRSRHYCDSSLDSDDVSRRHVRLTRDGLRLLVEDLNSAQGSFLAHRRLSPFVPAAVAEGDSLKVAGHSFRLGSIPPRAGDRAGAGGPLATATVGRHAECDLQLGDASVSRRHAELVLGDDGRVLLSDRCSTRGTFCLRDGKWRRIDHVQLEDGMQLRFGTVEVPARRLIAAARAAKRPGTAERDEARPRRPL